MVEAGQGDRDRAAWRAPAEGAVADWRVGRGWSAPELEVRLTGARSLGPNFDPTESRTPDRGWHRHGTETVIAREPAGPPRPGGPFQRAWEAVTRYEFSDPRIVRAHFDPWHPLEGRRLLLELRPLALHYLCPVVVGAVRDERSDAETLRGYRCDTLRGHLEAGSEWFLLSKSHATGEVRFRIEAEWRAGDFPNAWSRLGFRLLGRRYQRAWSRRAHHRLRLRVQAPHEPARAPVRLVHQRLRTVIPTRRKP